LFNIHANVATNKIDTPGINLISIIPLYNGDMEESIKFAGITSHGECIKYDVHNNKAELSVHKIEALSDSQTAVATLSVQSINNNKSLLFIGTSYGHSSLLLFDKADDGAKTVFKLNESYGKMKALTMHNNALTF